MSIFDQLTDIFRTRKTKRSGDYAEICRNVADGVPVNADTVADVLESAGKSAEDLRADVEVLEKRREWATVVKTENSVRKSYRESEAAFNAAKERYSSAKQRYDDATVAWRDAGNLFNQKLTEIETAKTRLAASAPPEMREAEEVILNELSELRERKQELEELLNLTSGSKRKDRVRLSDGRREKTINSLREDCLLSTAEIDERERNLRRELDKASSRIQVLEKEHGKHRRQVLSGAAK